MSEIGRLGSHAIRDNAQVALNQVGRFSFRPSLQGGVNSYGRAVGIIASIAIVILLVSVPLFYAFNAVYSKIQTNREGLETVRMNLAENRLQALQKVLPDRSFQKQDFKVGVFEYRQLVGMGYSRKEVESLLKSSIDESAPPALHKLSQKYNLLKNRISARDNLLKKGGFSYEKIKVLAEEGKQTRHLEAFLLKKGVFGSDPNCQKFQLGKEVVQHIIGELDFLDGALEINKIMDAIKEAPKEGLEEYLQVQIRESVDRLQQNALYQILLEIEGREHPFVAAVQDFALALRLDSQGMEQLRGLGSTYLKLVKEEKGDVVEGESVSYLADALDETIGKHHWSYKIESLFDKLLVYRRYPDKTAMAVLSHRPDRALDYNSYKVGNFDMAFGNFGLGQNRIRAIHGPTPTSDQLLIAQLEAQKERGEIHLQHNLEHPAFSKGDRVRINYLLDIQERFPETFRLISTPLDGPVMRLEGEEKKYFEKCTSVEQFFLKYGTYAFTGEMEAPPQTFDGLKGNAHRIVSGKNDNGFYLGKEVMSDEQFKSAFKGASEAFSFVNFESAREKKRLARALQVAVQGFISVGAVVKTLQDTSQSPEDVEEALLKASFGQACKLDIDRGVILNVMTRVYFQLAAGNSLKEDDIAEIIGTVVGRAELVSGRTIIFDRYQPLSDALRLIAANEQQVKSGLESYLQQGFGVQGDALSYQSV